MRRVTPDCDGGQSPRSRSSSMTSCAVSGALQQTQMVGILSLQRTDEQFELWHPAQVHETRIFEEEGPTREAPADAPLQPFQASFAAPSERKNASDLVVVVMRVSKRLWTRTSLGHVVERQFLSPGLRIEDALQADDERVFRQQP